MKNYRTFRNIAIEVFLVLIICIYGNTLFALSPETQAEQLFKQARQLAYNEKDIDKARELTLAALKMEQENLDMRVFLGQLYTWEKKHYEQARESFYFVLRRQPGHEEASLGIVELEIQNEHYTDALFYCGKGLYFHPDSEKLLLKKIEILTALRRYMEGREALSILLRKIPDSEQGLLLKRTGIRKINGL